MAHGESPATVATGVHTQGRNFAPVKPLEDAKRTKADTKDNPSSINAFFREKWQEKRLQYDNVWRELIEQARVIQNMRAGKLVMKRDMTGSGYVFFPRNPNAAQDRSNFPIFPQNSETLKSKWMRSRPMMEAQAFGDGYRVEQALNSINLVVKTHFRRMFAGVDNFYESDEALSAQDYGTYITQIYYDDRLNQVKQQIPIIKNESQVLVPGYGACLECGHEGHPDDFSRKEATYPQCPSCDSFRTTRMIPDAVAEVPSVVGVDEIVQGDLGARLINFAACRFDPHVFAHQSSFFTYDEYLPLNLINKMLGEDLDIHATESDNLGLELADALATRGGTIEGWGESDLYNRTGALTNERAAMHSMWLKPEEYAGVKFSEAEKTLGGTIPADVPLDELFPEGLCVVGFEDMKLQIGLFDEAANLASAAYLTMSNSGIGKGINDGVELAKDLNEIHSMAMSGLKRLGASGVVVDAGSGITQETLRNMFKPNRATFVDLKSAGIDDIRKAVTQLQMNPVNPVLPQYAIQLTNMSNMAMMTGDFTQGMVQDVDINTLGGQQLAHAKAEEQKGAILTGKAWHRQQCATLIVKLERKHKHLGSYYTYGNDQMGVSRGKYVTGADLPEQVDFVPVPDSEVPANRAEKQIAVREFVEKAGGIGNVIMAAQQAPKETAWFMEQYGVTLPTLDTQQMQLVCIERVDEIKQLGQTIDDPYQILSSLKKKVKVGESLHTLKAEFLGQMLDDDEVDEWPPWVLQAVEMLIDLHYDYFAEFEARKGIIGQVAQGKVQMVAGQIQQELMRPLIEQQQAAEMQAAQQQNDAQAEQGVLNFLGDMANKAVDATAAEDQHARDMERDQAADDRKLQMQQQQQKADAAANPPTKEG